MNFSERYSDDKANLQMQKKLIEENICPPVSFRYGSTHSDQLPWIKTIGTGKTVIDFPEADPAERCFFPVTYETDGLRVEMEFTVYPGYPVLEYSGKLISTSDGLTSVISKLSAVNRIITDSQKVILHYNKGSQVTTEDFCPYTVPIAPGNAVSFAETGGKPTFSYLQGFNAESEDGGVIINMSWQGCWKADFNGQEDGLFMTGGQLNTEFILLPGETFRIPRIIFLFYRGNSIYGQNIRRRWFYRCNVLRRQGMRMNKNVLVCIGDGYPGMLGNAADDIKEAARLHNEGVSDLIDHFTQDVGWYDVKPGTDWTYTGNWYPDSIRYPDGMKPVSDKIHECGMKYTVWFEPERIRCGTAAANTLRDKVITLEDCGDGKTRYLPYDKTTEGQTCLVNYAFPEAVDYCVDTIDRIITEQGIDLYRQDYNISPAPYWNAYDIYTGLLKAFNLPTAEKKDIQFSYDNNHPKFSLLKSKKSIY